MTRCDIPAERLPKLLGADVELGNLIVGRARSADTCAEAALALLGEFEGVGAPWTPRSLIPSSPRFSNPQDWGRRFLPSNGGCAYIDLDHLELCVPETLSAWDHVAAWHAMLRLAQRAQRRTNAQLPAGERVEVLVNNSDGLGNSYGAHLNVLLARPTWERLLCRRPQYLGLLASFQASLLVLTGQGKVGGENGRRHAGYQLSQRADFLETLLGLQTTFRRPLINTRDEPLAGRAGPGSEPPARLHVICFDATLCPVATLLKVGAMQLFLAMLEAGEAPVELILEDPLDAVREWSADPSLTGPARLAGRDAIGAVALQRRFAERAGAFVARGEADGLVPRAAELVHLWQGTLDRLAAGDWSAVVRRLDWALKLALIERALGAPGDDGWQGPDAKVLDHRYAALDPEAGLYWAIAAAGGVEQPVPEARIEHFTAAPPEDTRAWGRAMWLRAVPPDALVAVDWDAIRFRLARRTRGGTRRVQVAVSLASPLGSTRAALGRLFSTDRTLDRLVGAARRPRRGAHGAA